MISVILATIAFLIAIEGIIIAFFCKSVKKFMREISKKKDAEKLIKTIGLYEALIGFILLVVAIILRNI